MSVWSAGIWDFYHLQMNLVSMWILDEDEQICLMGCLADADNQFLCSAATILFFLCGAEF